MRVNSLLFWIINLVGGKYFFPLTKACVIISFFTFAQGQNFFPILGGQRVGTSVFTFLKIGVSARAVGMGEAVAALQQDAGSVYYNPGTIAQFKQSEFSASRIQWPAEINYDYFSLTRKITGRHFAGISFGILHLAPMRETTEFLPHGTGNYFLFQDRFIALTYGVRMTDRFSFGITLKQVEEELAGQTMSTGMLDMGTFYWTGFRSLSFSASLSHFGPQAKPDGTFQKHVLDTETGEEKIIKADFESFSPPTVFRVGAAMDIWKTEMQSIIVALQMNHPVDNAENISTGFEYNLADLLFLRSGYKINKEEENVSFGAGLIIPIGKLKLRVDYAIANFNHLSDPQRLSLGIAF
ncbi:MAG: PorV/PorQ family protein [Fidelibacterota bacterium]